MVKFSSAEQAAQMRAAMEKYIGAGQGRAQNVVRRVIEDAPVDAVVRRTALRFDPAARAVVMKIGGTLGSVTLRSNRRTLDAAWSKTPIW